MHRGRIYQLGGLVLLLLCSIVLFFGPTDNWNWDPSFYYAQMRAPIIDHTLDFRQETKPPGAISVRTVTGLEPSVWPIGPSMLWAPFFVLAHAFVLVSGWQAGTRGFGTPYVAAVSAGAALYGLLGLIVTYRLCRLFGNRALAALATVTILLATPLFYYIYRQPLMGHSAGFLATALLLYVLVQIERGVLPVRLSGVVVGVLVGLNVLVRWIGITSVVLPAVLFASLLAHALQRREPKQVALIVRQMGIALVCAIVVMLPQLALWHRLYNAWLVPPVGKQPFAFRVVPPFLLDLFFHTNRGLLYWAPIVLVGMVGVLWLDRGLLRVMLGAYLAGVLFVLGSWVTWHGGGGYGARYFIETCPVIAVGCTVLARPLWRHRWGRVAVALVAALLSLQQFVLVVMVEQIWLPLRVYFDGGPLGIGFQMAAWKRLLAHPATLFAARPYIAPSHQALITNLPAGANTAGLFVIPLVAMVVISLGCVLFWRHARLDRLPLVARLFMAYTVAWFGFLLLV